MWTERLPARLSGAVSGARLARRVSRVLLATLTAVLTVGTSAIAAPLAQPAAQVGGYTGGTLVYAMPFEVKTFDPHRSNEETATMALGNIYDTLLYLDPSDPRQVVPGLATEWHSDNNNTVFTLVLRDGAFFSTGNRVTASDVKFSLDRLWNLQASPSFILEGMQSVEVVDPRSVRISLAKPDAAFLAKLAFTPVAIVDSQVAAANGAVSDASAPTADAAEAFFNQTSIGSGAFTLGGYVPDSQLVLTRNPTHWGGGALVDQVILTNVPEPTAQRQLLERGEVDIAQTLDFRTASDLIGRPGLNVQFVPTINTIYMFLTSNPTVSQPISKPEVRQAIQRALDYDGILALVEGHGRRPPTTIPLDVLGADAVTPVQQDLNEARRLLSQAGYPNGFEVDVPYPDGTRYNVSWGLLMAKIQADLARVGITLKLQPVQSAIFLDSFRASKLALGLSFWSPDYVDPDDWVGPFWSSEVNFLTKRLGYRNSEVDRLVRQSLAETGPGIRYEVYRQLQQLFLADANLFTVLQPDAVLASNSRVDGYRPIYELRQVDFSKVRLLS